VVRLRSRRGRFLVGRVRHVRTGGRADRGAVYGAARSREHRQPNGDQRGSQWDPSMMIAARSFHLCQETLQLSYVISVTP
jgi:hypothetical protein